MAVNCCVSGKDEPVGGAKLSADFLYDLPVRQIELVQPQIPHILSTGGETKRKQDRDTYKHFACAQLKVRIDSSQIGGRSLKTA